jgi:hypothetical protein
MGAIGAVGRILTGGGDHRWAVIAPAIGPAPPLDGQPRSHPEEVLTIPGGRPAIFLAPAPGSVDPVMVAIVGEII